MKKSLSPLMLAAAILLPAHAMAESLGVYVAPRLTTGMVSYGDDVWTYGGALAVGYNFLPSLKVPMRLELEYNKLADVSKTNKDDEYRIKGTVGVSTLFVNAYFDWHNRTAFTPYVNLGVGQSFLSAKLKDTDTDTGRVVVLGKKTTTHVGWNIGLGSSLRLSDDINLDLGYRYASLGKARTKGEKDDEDKYATSKNVQTHQLLLGVRFAF